MPTNQNAERDAAIAAAVRAEAARRQIRQSEIAVHLGLTQPGTSRRMHGRVPFTAAELAEVAKLFGTTVDCLLGEQVA